MILMYVFLQFALQSVVELLLDVWMTSQHEADVSQGGGRGIETRKQKQSRLLIQI